MMSLSLLLLPAAAAFSFGAPLRASSRCSSVLMASSQKMSFETALESAPAFCSALQAGESPSGLGEFISTSAGARGFFVHWLTGDDFSCADEEPPSALIESLEQVGGGSPEVLEVMLMNVVMSAATAVAHERAGNAEQAASSQRTCKRACALVSAVNTPALKESCKSLKAAVAQECGKEILLYEEEAEGAVVAAAEKAAETRVLLVEAQEAAVDAWSAFLVKWQYEKEQLDKVSEALATCE